LTTLAPSTDTPENHGRTSALAIIPIDPDDAEEISERP
jgi:hypothetical protein